MKKYCLRLKMIIAAMVICSISISVLAQIQRNTSITFYGKVIDQNNQPIMGATVKLVVAGDPSESNLPEEQDYTLNTDVNGNFRLMGAYGWSMQIASIAKSGYELSTKAQRGYSYLMASDIHHPDINAPVLIRMWKSVGKEPLSHSAWHGKIACDGTTNRFDLESGRSSAEGNLAIACTRTPLNYVRINGPSFSYKFEITLIGGSIQTTGDEFTYLAPDGGYLPSVTLERKPGDPQWKAGLDQEFYIKTTDGHYGRISVVWDAGHRPSPTPLRWECFLNPFGSRNLER